MIMKHTHINLKYWESTSDYKCFIDIFIVLNDEVKIIGLLPQRRYKG